jgi:hypothetical protein
MGKSRRAKRSQVNDGFARKYRPFADSLANGPSRPLPPVPVRSGNGRNATESGRRRYGSFAQDRPFKEETLPTRKIDPWPTFPFELLKYRNGLLMPRNVEDLLAELASTSGHETVRFLVEPVWPDVLRRNPQEAYRAHAPLSSVALALGKTSSALSTWAPVSVESNSFLP